jgi:hypothetical protein
MVAPIRNKDIASAVHVHTAGMKEESVRPAPVKMSLQPRYFPVTFTNHVCFCARDPMHCMCLPAAGCRTRLTLVVLPATIILEPSGDTLRIRLAPHSLRYRQLVPSTHTPMGESNGCSPVRSSLPAPRTVLTTWRESSCLIEWFPASSGRVKHKFECGSVASMRDVPVSAM